MTTTSAFFMGSSLGRAARLRRASPEREARARVRALSAVGSLRAMRELVWGCVLLVVMAAAARAQDPVTPAKERLVVKARLKGVKVSPPDDLVTVLAWDPASP